jgi:hypothetical protein
MSDFIYDVVHFARDTDGGLICRCPHCQAVIGVEGEDGDDVRGEQFQCRCGGWLEITNNARYIKLRGDDELPANKGVPDED